MNKNTFITLIAVMLTLFVLVKVVFDQLCAPAPTNTVTQAISNVVSVAPASPAAAKSEPLSWEPVLQQLATFFSKACPR